MTCHVSKHITHISGNYPRSNFPWLIPNVVYWPSTSTHFLFHQPITLGFLPRRSSFRLSLGWLVFVPFGQNFPSNKLPPKKGWFRLELFDREIWLLTFQFSASHLIVNDIFVCNDGFPALWFPKKTIIITSYSLRRGIPTKTTNSPTSS